MSVEVTSMPRTFLEVRSKVCPIQNILLSQGRVRDGFRGSTLVGLGVMMDPVCTVPRALDCAELVLEELAGLRGLSASQTVGHCERPGSNMSAEGQT